MSMSNEELKCMDNLMDENTILKATNESLQGMREYLQKELGRVQDIAVREQIKVQIWRYLAHNEQARSVVVEFDVLTLEDGWAVVFLIDVPILDPLPTGLRDHVWVTTHSSSIFVPKELRKIYNNITKKEDEENQDE